MKDKIDGVLRPEHIIPFPESISDEAQAALRRQVGENGVSHNARFAMPSHTDSEAWKQIQATSAAWYAEAMKSRPTSSEAELQTLQIEQATVHVAVPGVLASEHHVLVGLHGGAFTFGGGEACKASARTQAVHYGLRCYSVDYRMPPEQPYPAALDDCLATYRYLLDRYAAENIVIAGRSAGGNLAAAMVLRARDEGLPLPGALVLLSPEADLTESGDSFQVNQLVDVVLPGSLSENNLLYAAGADLTHPYLSPLFGDFTHGFPATFIQSGTRDLFLSNAVRLHRALRKAHIEAELHVFEAMPHGGFMGSPEDKELVEEMANFIRRQLRLVN
ncbi:alpha/beta hydrolase [Cedecea davisae]|uniref:Alpha/beta hydrolase n=1 Tax=Cedecea davisae TaxID=158484 RepID=A0ABS6DEV7_9ENTR|nr:alpha/beta hydrolase [Cedecea davisae]MBU4681746.1 alpha/beta hydrolase [Cedecea davisae]MBU4689186.1 alpha/beta hydrolase [Cedecea davisae]